jgi:hypothetical protein
MRGGTIAADHEKGGSSGAWVQRWVPNSRSGPSRHRVQHLPGGARGVRTLDLTDSKLCGARLCWVMGDEYHMPRSGDQWIQYGSLFIISPHGLSGELSDEL